MTTSLNLPHAVSAIAGVALDQIHDLTITQIDQWTEQIREKLGATPAPAPALPAPANGVNRANGGGRNFGHAAAAPAPVVQPVAKTGSPAVRKAVPLMIGAVIGAVLAVSLIERAKAAKAARAVQDDFEGEHQAHQAHHSDEV